MIASIPIFVLAVPGGSDGVSRVISVLGIAKVQGEDAIVDILVEVQPGQNANEVARAALAAQGARPFESASLGSAGFTVSGLVWDNLAVVQNYNPGSSNTEDAPAGLVLNGQTALTNTHGTWDGADTSFFDINFGGLTVRCPSLVRECEGSQVFDGNNDVAWLKLRPGVLGVTWWGTNIDEADMVLNTRFNWNDGCTDVKRSFDAQTVFLHENGHVVGLLHSDIKEAVMYPSYQGARCSLLFDDEEGATFLYDDSKHMVSGSVTDTEGNFIEGAIVLLEGTLLSDETDVNGDYAILDVPDPVTYDITASIGDTSGTIRQTVDGDTTVNFILDTSGGTEDDGGGGPPKCVPKKFC